MTILDYAVMIFAFVIMPFIFIMGMREWYNEVSGKNYIENKNPKNKS